MFYFLRCHFDLFDFVFGDAGYAVKTFLQLADGFVEFPDGTDIGIEAEQGRFIALEPKLLASLKEQAGDGVENPVLL